MKRIIIFLVLLLTACAPAAVSVSSRAPTVDPFVAVEQAQRTAQAAQNEAEFYGSQLTATAQAPIVSITQTAAAFAMQQEYAAATSQAAQMTETAAITATARSWTATPNATMTAVFANSYAEATKISNSIALDNLQVERAKTTNSMRAMSVYIIGFLALFVALMFGIVMARKLAVHANPVDDRGNPLPMFDVVEGTAWDIDRAVNGVISTRPSFLKLLPAITAERQDMVTSRDQLVDLRTRSRLPKRLVESQSAGLLSAPTAPIEKGSLEAFSLPEWESFSNYSFQMGGDFPFGSFEKELARIDVNKYPHIGLVGPTGCGKSRLFLRPFIASALASGNRVIVLGDMVDFIVFKVHPNVTLVPVYQITKPDDAAQYVNALKVINSEMENRFKLLADQNLSTWERFGGENTLIVLDELGPNLDILDDTNPQAARALRGFLSILISKGRKAGFNFIFASTRAVGLKKQLSQVSTIAFRLKDTDEERYAFGQSGFGAERLPENYFLSKIGSSVRMTGSFNPSDQQLGEFLLRHTTKELDKPTWIEGVFKPVERDQLPAANDALPLPEPSVQSEVDVEQVMELHRAGKSMTAIVNELTGSTGGRPWMRVKRLVEAVITTATTTTKSPEMTTFTPELAR